MKRAQGNLKRGLQVTTTKVQAVLCILNLGLGLFLVISNLLVAWIIQSPLDSRSTAKGISMIIAARLWYLLMIQQMRGKPISMPHMIAIGTLGLFMVI